jgi:hypothetical protein
MLETHAVAPWNFGTLSVFGNIRETKKTFVDIAGGTMYLTLADC